MVDTRSERNSAKPDMLAVLNAILKDARNEAYSPESRLQAIADMASDAIAKAIGDSQTSGDEP